MLEMDIEECFRMRNATKKRIRKKDLDDDDEGRTDKKQKKMIRALYHSYRRIE